MKVYYNSACPVCKAGIESQMEKGASARSSGQMYTRTMNSYQRFTENWSLFENACMS